MSETVRGAFSTLPERASQEITLPSGLRITILETTGQQEALFSNLTRGKVHETINKYLSQVTKDLQGAEPGPVREATLDAMLSGDRSAIVLHTRILNHGPVMEYTLQCNNTQCNATSEHEIDVQGILDRIVPYPAGDQREFRVELDGATLYFELPNGIVERKLAALAQPDFNSRLNCMRLWEVTDKGNLPVHVRDLRSRHIAALRKAVKAQECQIDATVDVVCTACGQVHRIGLLEKPDFLFPHST